MVAKRAHGALAAKVLDAFSSLVDLISCTRVVNVKRHWSCARERKCACASVAAKRAHGALAAKCCVNAA